jgi:hypothetical protein
VTLEDRDFLVGLSLLLGIVMALTMALNLEYFHNRPAEILPFTLLFGLAIGLLLVGIGILAGSRKVVSQPRPRQVPSAHPPKANPTPLPSPPRVVTQTRSHLIPAVPTAVSGSMSVPHLEATTDRSLVIFHSSRCGADVYGGGSGYWYATIECSPLELDIRPGRYHFHVLRCRRSRSYECFQGFLEPGETVHLISEV